MNQTSNKSQAEETQKAPSFCLVSSAKKCPNCRAEMEREDVRTSSAVNDREVETFTPIWTCPDCGYEEDAV